MRKYYYQEDKDRVRIGINKKITKKIMKWKDGDEIIQIPCSECHLMLENFSKMNRREGEKKEEEEGSLKSNINIVHKNLWLYLLERVQATSSLPKPKSPTQKRQASRIRKNLTLRQIQRARDYYRKSINYCTNRIKELDRKELEIKHKRRKTKKK